MEPGLRGTPEAGGQTWGWKGSLKLCREPMKVIFVHLSIPHPNLSLPCPWSSALSLGGDTILSSAFPLLPLLQSSVCPSTWPHYHAPSFCRLLSRARTRVRQARRLGYKLQGGTHCQGHVNGGDRATLHVHDPESECLFAVCAPKASGTPLLPGPALRWALWQPNPQDLGGQGPVTPPSPLPWVSSPLFTGYGKGAWLLA